MEARVYVSDAMTAQPVEIGPTQKLQIQLRNGLTVETGASNHGVWLDFGGRRRFLSVHKMCELLGIPDPNPSMVPEL